ncbi:hypothetical protein BGZ46_007613 [Entomortierella lignicola]|nr:hypothetical protein BGZ46_007613 [Entomortierella lignicola]
MSFTSLPPPPRRAQSSSTGLGARRPKVNPMASTIINKTNTFLSADTTHVHAVSPVFLVSVPSPIPSILALIAVAGPVKHLDPLFQIQLSDSVPLEGNEGTQICQRRALSITEDDANEQNMADVAGYFPSCSYCSSVRSNSVSSILEEQHLGLDGSSQRFESHRMEHLRALVPSEMRQRLRFHLDECWIVMFSPSAEYMATIGRDHSVVVWKDLMSPDPSIHISISLSRTINTIEWSPDSKYLLVNLGYDSEHLDFIPTLKLIDVLSGEILFREHYKKDGKYTCVNAISWFPDSQRFLTAIDGIYCIWDLNGKIIREYPVDKALVARQMKSIPGRDEFVVNTLNTTEIVSFDDTMTSRPVDTDVRLKVGMCVSRDANYLAITLRGDKLLDRPSQIAVYDLKTMTFLRYFDAETYISEEFLVTPAFAGPNMELLCVGSENGKVHYWDIETGELVAVLEEHSTHVGCVSSNPGHPGMVASCSDDSHVILWATKYLQFELKEDDEKWLHENPPTAVPTIAIKKGW